MRRKQHRAFLADLADQLAHFHNLTRVETNRRLVEDQHFGAMQKRLSESHALTHPFGKIADISIGAVKQADHLQRFIHALIHVGDVAQLAHELQIIEHDHIGIQRNCFGQIAHALANLKRLFHHIVSRDNRFAIGWRHIARENTHGRCLARAVRTEKADDLALLSVET